MKRKAPGKTMLQVVGIILIVLGIISLFSAGSAIFMGQQIASGTLDPTLTEALEVSGVPMPSAQEMIVSGVITVLSSIVYIVSGFIGAKFCNRVEKGGFCFKFGILLVVCCLASSAYSAVQGSFSVASTLISLIFPMLYTWGALRNKDADPQVYQ